MCGSSMAHATPHHDNVPCVQLDVLATDVEESARHYMQHRAERAVLGVHMVGLPLCARVCNYAPQSLHVDAAQVGHAEAACHGHNLISNLFLEQVHGNAKPQLAIHAGLEQIRAFVAAPLTEEAAHGLGPRCLPDVSENLPALVFHRRLRAIRQMLRASETRCGRLGGGGSTRQRGGTGIAAALLPQAILVMQSVGLLTSPPPIWRGLVMSVLPPGGRLHLANVRMGSGLPTRTKLT